MKIITILTKIFFTLLVIAILFIDIFCKQINVTYITLLLLIIAILPWLGNLKSLEISNIGKIEWFSKEQKEDIKKNSNLLQPKNKGTSEEIFLYEDNIPFLLAQLRTETEKRLLKLCELSKMKTDKQGVHKLASRLYESNVINNQEYNLIRDLLPAMNAAVHGRLDNRNSMQYNWLVEVAKKLINSLDEKINNN